MKNSTWQFNSLTDEAKAALKARAFQIISDTVQMDMLPDAAQNSPRLTGNNARSIDAETKWISGTDIQAEMYTQSGYGGYLELGTIHMAARPYMYPAFVKFQAILLENLRRLGYGTT